MKDTIILNKPTLAKITIGSHSVPKVLLLKIMLFKDCIAHASGVNLEITCIYFGAISNEKKEPPIIPLTAIMIDAAEVNCFWLLINGTIIIVMQVNANK